MQNQEIINQLKAVLPRFTDDFTSNFAITSLTRSGSVITANTSSAHGLIIGDKPLIKGAKTPITIDSLTRVGVYATAITASDYSLVKNQASTEIIGADQSDYNGNRTLIWETPIIDIISIEISGNTATVTTKSAHGLINDSNIQVKIAGANDNYSGTFSLDSVPSSTTFTYTVYGETSNAIAIGGQLMQMRLLLNSRVFMFEVANSPTTPATGDITQLAQYKEGYNGYKTVASVPTATSFTYVITETPDSPAQGTIKVNTFPAITGAIDLERAKKFYENISMDGQTDKWIITVVEDEVVSKNNSNRTDASSVVISGNIIRESSYQNLNVYIFLPCGATNDELMYLITRDAGSAYKPYIYKSLLGFSPSSNLSEDSYSKLTPIGNGMQEFNGSYYIHNFSFQATEWTNQEDAVDPSDLFAFRTFDFDVIDNEGFETSVMEIAGDVDQP